MGNTGERSDVRIRRVDSRSEEERTVMSRELLIIGQAARSYVYELAAEMNRRGWRCRVLMEPLPAAMVIPQGTDVFRGKRLDVSTAWRRILSWGLFSWQAIAT